MEIDTHSSHPFVALRARKGWSQSDLAKVLGISRALVGHFETGARTISAEMAIAFESKLQLDVTRQALRPDLWSSQAA